MAGTMKDVMNYFEMNTAEFGKAWRALTPADKDDLKNGLVDGSMTY